MTIAPRPHLKLSRRRFIAASSAASALGGCAASRVGRRSELVFVGVHGPQIHALWFDPQDGAIDVIGPVAGNPRPTWAVRHPTLPILYFTDESGNDGSAQGGVQAFAVDETTGALTKISDIRAGGGGTTHLWFDRGSSAIVASNFASGSIATVEVSASGALGAVSAPMSMVGSGPHRRQRSARVHATCVVGGFVLASDFGADRLWVIPYDARTGIGRYDPAASGHYVAPPGSGPRHFSFHPDGATLYLVAELTGEVHVLSWDPAAGRLEMRQEVTLDDPDFTGAPSGSEIAVSADGRFAYASNRADNSLVVFAIDAGARTLTRLQKIASGGERPWHFALHPGGEWLLCANRDANALRAFRVDRQSGLLADTGVSVEVPSPVHVHFFG